MMIDAHVHIQDVSENRRAALLAAARENRVDLLFCNGTSPSDWDAVAALADVPSVIPFIGVHPWKVNGLPDDWETRLADCVRRCPCGIGEIGLDGGPKGGPADQQRDVFRRQIRMAAAMTRPCIVHCVQAWEALCAELRACSGKDLMAVIHGFGGSLPVLTDLLSLGAMISIGPRSLSRKNIRHLLDRIPDDQLLLETDFPYLPGMAVDQAEAVDYCKALNDVYSKTAILRGVSIDDLSATVHINAERVAGMMKSL